MIKQKKNRYFILTLFIKVSELLVAFSRVLQESFNYGHSIPQVNFASFGSSECS